MPTGCERKIPSEVVLPSLLHFRRSFQSFPELRPLLLGPLFDRGYPTVLGGALTELVTGEDSSDVGDGTFALFLSDEGFNLLRGGSTVDLVFPAGCANHFLVCPFAWRERAVTSFKETFLSLGLCEFLFLDWHDGFLMMGLNFGIWRC